MPEPADQTRALLELSPLLKHLSKRLTRPPGPRLAEHSNYDPVLPRKEAADYCGCHPTTLTEDAYAGLVPYLRRSNGERGRLRFRLSDLNRYLEAQRVNHRTAQSTGSDAVDWGA